jgi:hypothetical protein
MKYAEARKFGILSAGSLFLSNCQDDLTLNKTALQKRATPRFFTQELQLAQLLSFYAPFHFPPSKSAG